MIAHDGVRKVDPNDPFEEGSENEEVAQAKIQEAAQVIITRLTRLVTESLTRKGPVEKRWLSDIRALQGRYDEDVEELLRKIEKSGGAKSRAFVNMARSKTNIWEGRLAELLFPSDDKNWGIGPTPVPALTKQAQDVAKAAEAAHEQAEAAAEQANMAAAQGNPEAQMMGAAQVDQIGAQAKELEDTAANLQTEVDEARKRAEAMEKEIADQLLESNYGTAARDAIRDACRLGPGILKGPCVASNIRRKWETGPDGSAQLSYSPDARPTVHRVDPWHFFPDWNATKMEECEWTLERHMPSSRQLKAMAKTLGFSEEAVRNVLRDGPQTNLSVDLKHLSDLRAINDEGQPVTDRYVMWEFNGSLECDEICALLRAMGKPEDADRYLEQDDPLNERMVTVWFCNGHVLKMAEYYLLDSGETLYSVFPFDPGEASIMGARGVPSLIHDSLRALNAAWRQMLDNSALAAQPQIVVDKTQLAPENGDWRLSPGKVWIRVEPEQIGTKQRPFETYEIPHNQAQIAGVIELALKFMDEESGLPLIAQGEQDQHITQTAGGMAMLFNSANVVFRRVVKYWDDDITVPLIRRFYDWNMQFSTKEDIKGDMNVEARGTSVLLAQEMQAQNLMALATNWSVHPILKHALRGQGYHAASMAIQSMRISKADIMVSSEDFEKSLAAEAASAPESPDVIRAQATLEAAKITADSRKADGEVQLQIAEIRRQTELVALAANGELTLEQLKTQLAIKDLDNQSKERIFAAETAVQQKEAAAARAAGEPAPGGGGGYV